MQQWINDYKAGMLRFNQFSGRTGVGAFWRFTAVNILILVVLLALGAASSLALILYLVYAVVLIIPSLAIGVRRLHDSGKSGWFILTGFIPFVGFIILIVLYVQPSDGPNQYGQGPDDSPNAPAAW